MMPILRPLNQAVVHLWYGSLILFCIVSMSACEQNIEPDVVRPVRGLVIETHLSGDLIALTGQLHARDETKLAFRLSGKLIQSSVNVGDMVRAGQILAYLDAATERHTRNAAQADHAAALALLDQTTAAEKRFGNLLKEKAVSQAEYEEAVRQLKAAKSQVNVTRAKLNSAEVQLSYAELKADATGVITAKGAEPGEVVQAGQMVFVLAHQEGRDAVFDMPAQIIRDGLAPRQEIDVWLADNPAIKTVGHVREISPQANPSTRTYPVKVSLESLPAGMFLGSTIVGRVKLRAGTQIEIPSSALMMRETHPAVWVIDPNTQTVQKREIEVARYHQNAVVIASGLESGERIVTAGAHSLHQGQRVTLLEEVNGRR
ncbi:MAG: efflux RND transporter periplasmic adaptor subunit [Nitrospira sp.]|nr:efflux RND transporter periplasmic adaptor subunit [Nitrospira sp.]